MSVLSECAKAFSGGAASVTSPCVIPVLFGGFLVLSAASLCEARQARPLGEEMTRVATHAFLFAFGFAGAFALFMAFRPSSILVSKFLWPFLGTLSGALTVAAGLRCLSVRTPRAPSRAGSFAAGTAVAWHWIPCVGPLLGSLLALTIQPESQMRGAYLLFVYAIGLSPLFGVMGLSLAALSRAARGSRRVTLWTGQAAAVALVIFGAVMALGGSRALLFFIPRGIGVP